MTHQKNKKNNNKHSKKKTKNNKRLKLFIIIAIIAIGLVFILTNKKINKYNEKIQLVLNNENITNNLENDIFINNKQIYLSYNDIKAFIDSTLYTEKENNIIITSSEKKLAVINIQEQTLEINSSKVDTKDLVLVNNNTTYLAISELESVYNVEINYHENSNIITIDNLNKKSIKAYANNNIKVKENTNLFAKAIDSVNKGNWLYFIEEQNGYAKMRTQDGVIGFIKIKNLTNFINERDDFIEKTNDFDDESALKIDITQKDISTYEKRKEIINSILKDAIKQEERYIKIIYDANNSQEYERFKIEAIPVFAECGIKAK